jgi:hypothetical protein
LTITNTVPLKQQQQQQVHQRRSQMYKQAPTNIWNVANRGKRAHGVDMAGIMADM